MRACEYVSIWIPSGVCLCFLCRSLSFPLPPVVPAFRLFAFCRKCASHFCLPFYYVYLAVVYVCACGFEKEPVQMIWQVACSHTLCLSKSLPPLSSPHLMPSTSIRIYTLFWFLFLKPTAPRQFVCAFRWQSIYWRVCSLIFVTQRTNQTNKCVNVSTGTGSG